MLKDAKILKYNAVRSHHSVSSVGATIGRIGPRESRIGLDDPAEEGRDGVDPAGDVGSQYRGVAWISTAYG